MAGQSRRDFLKTLGVGALTLAVSSLAAPPAFAQGARRPNFIFILTDDQGWAESSVRMHPAVPESCCAYFSTPNMERLAATGMRFSSGYSPGPLCTPTRRSVLCGMSPARERGTEFKSEFDPRGHLTIPRALKQADGAYRCAHFGKWGEMMVATPEQSGYDESDGMTGNLTGGGRGAGDLQAAETDFAAKDDPKLTFSVTDRAMDFIARQVAGQKPFYVQVSYYALHMQIQARRETIQKYDAKGAPPRTFPTQFAAMAEDMDTGLGRLLDKLDELGIADNTYVFLGADNGGSPYGRELPLYNKMLGVNEPGAARNQAANAVAFAPGVLPVNYPLRGAKQWLYEGGIRVPFIVRGPSVKAGAWCHEPVAHYDLLPTLVDLAGGDVAKLPAELDGGSLRPLLHNEGRGAVKRALPGLVFHRPGRNYSAYREGDWKLVIAWGSDGEPAKKELFNLAKDLGEQRNLAEAMPEKAEQLWGTLSQYLKAVNAETVSDFGAAGKKKKTGKPLNRGNNQRPARKAAY